MHPSILQVLALGGALAITSAQAQTCGAGQTLVKPSGATPQCCTTIRNILGTVTCSNDASLVGTAAGRLARRCTVGLDQNGGGIIETEGGSPLSISVLAQGSKGQSSSAGAQGGFGARVSARFTFDAAPADSNGWAFVGSPYSSRASPAAQGGNGGRLAELDFYGPEDFARLIVAGGGGAGGGPAGSVSDGKPARGLGACPGFQEYGTGYVSMGGYGGSCNPIIHDPYTETSQVGGNGGSSGFFYPYGPPRSGVYAITPGTMSSTVATTPDGAVIIDFECVPAPESTTTIFETVPSSTATITESKTVDTVYTTPPTYVTTTTVSAESVQPLQTATETYAPPTSIFTDFSDVTTTPPKSLEYSTIYPATRTVTETVDVTTTPLTSTTTAVMTSSTGVSNCVSFRMVYPAACCPNTYLNMTKTSSRLRRDGPLRLDRRALTTQQITDGVTSTTLTVDATATLAADTPSSIITETSYYPGPLTTVTSTFTADAPSETTTLTRYHEAQAETSTILSTASTPSTTVQTTVYHDAPTPVTTTTSTAFAQSTSCSVQVPNGIPKTCPIPLLADADRLAQISLINAKKALSGGRPVLIDCGAAGTFNY